MIKLLTGLLGLVLLTATHLAFVDCDYQDFNDVNIPLDLSHYHNYTSLQNLFRRLEKDHPSLVKLYSIGKSVQGRQLYVLRVSQGMDQVQESPMLLQNGDLTFALNGKPMFKYVDIDIMTQYNGKCMRCLLMMF